MMKNYSYIILPKYEKSFFEQINDFFNDGIPLIQNYDDVFKSEFYLDFLMDFLFLNNMDFVKLENNNLYIKYTTEKMQIFARYNFLSQNPSLQTNNERSLLLDIIVSTGWLKSYFRLYPNEFGL